MHGIRDRKFGEFITFDSTEEENRSSPNSDERQTREQMRLRAVVATSEASKPRNPNPKSTNCLKKKRPRQVPSATSETTQTRSAKLGAQKWRAQKKDNRRPEGPPIAERERETTQTRSAKPGAYKWRAQERQPRSRSSEARRERENYP